MSGGNDWLGMILLFLLLPFEDLYVLAQNITCITGSLSRRTRCYFGWLLGRGMWPWMCCGRRGFRQPTLHLQDKQHSFDRQQRQNLQNGEEAEKPSRCRSVGLEGTSRRREVLDLTQQMNNVRPRCEIWQNPHFVCLTHRRPSHMLHAARRKSAYIITPHAADGHDTGY